jgi:peptidoglycan endopeptidase LytE
VRFLESLCFLTTLLLALLAVSTVAITVCYLGDDPENRVSATLSGSVGDSPVCVYREDTRPLPLPVEPVALDIGSLHDSSQLGSDAPRGRAGEPPALPEVKIDAANLDQLTGALEGRAERQIAFSTRLSTITYRVVDGDSLLEIAQKFGITPETVLWANDIRDPQLLFTGQELTILPVSGVLHRVVQGDTVESIADTYNVDSASIRKANGLVESEEPLAGVELIVPGGMAKTPELFEPPPSQSPPPAEILAEAPRHRVSAGETLVSIADSYGVLPSAIQSANGLMDPDLVKAGQELIIPGGKAPEQVALNPTPVSDAPPPPFASVSTMKDAEPGQAIQGSTLASQQGEVVRYSVKKGDTLFSIARSHGVTPANLASANGIDDPNNLFAGIELVIPGAMQVAAMSIPVSTPTPTHTPTPTPTPQSPTTSAPQDTSVQVDGVRYRVNQGDTLFSIARAHGVTPDSVASANGLSDPSKLAAGMVLVIPDAMTTPAQATPGPVGQVSSTATPAPEPPTVAPAPDAHQSPPPAAQPPGDGSAGSRVAALAQKYVGHRYVWGGHSPDGFDCTGFTWYVYREAGITIPLHDLQGQMDTGQKVEKDQLQPGDLLFFQNTYKEGLSHVGIYLGDGRFINAETEKTGVQVRALSEQYWESRYLGASRPW